MILSPADTELEEIVAAYERAAKGTGGADLATFLPPTDSPLYRRALAELIRVDMEFAWTAGRPRCGCRSAR